MIIVLDHGLQKFKIIDEIIPEPLGGAHRDPEEIAASLKTAIVKQLKKLTSLETETLLDARYKKYRNIGEFTE